MFFMILVKLSGFCFPVHWNKVVYLLFELNTNSSQLHQMQQQSKDQALHVLVSCISLAEIASRTSLTHFFCVRSFSSFLCLLHLSFQSCCLFCLRFLFCLRCGPLQSQQICQDIIVNKFLCAHHEINNFTIQKIIPL
jgi:hypothetical protein